MKTGRKAACAAETRSVSPLPFLIYFTAIFFFLDPPILGWAEAHSYASASGVTSEDDAGVGLDEKLGQRIPLDLKFRDETFREVVLGDLIKVPTIIVPVYYRCPNVCSFLLGGLAQALPKVALDPGEDFLVLSLSIDENETSLLAQKSKDDYFTAMNHQFPKDAWLFLTGDRENIHKLTDSIGYRFQRRGADFLHPIAVAVVSPDGKIVRYLYGTSFLPMDLTLALLEASQGRVGASIRKVLSFCFSYDRENKRYAFNILRVSATVILGTAGTFLVFLIFTGRRKRED